MSERPGRAAPEWAAVVVNHDSGDHLTTCVQVLEEAGAAEIVVVDNASTDDSLATLEAAATPARLVRSGENLGYAGGANRGIERTSAPIVAVFNPDAVVRPDSVADVLRRFDEPDVGAVGPRIYDVSGETYPSARTVPSALDAAGHGLLGLVRPDNTFTRRYRQLDLDPGRPRDVDWVSGAAVWLRRRALAEVGGWDDGYFMYVEDVDLCWRLRSAGWRVVYEPGGGVEHVGGVSTRRHPYRMLLAHHRSLLRFSAKRYRGLRRPVLVPAAVVLAFRAALTMLAHLARSRRPRRRTATGREPLARRSETPDHSE